ncbi:hypothetical protein Tco_1210343 [Tanacetum coccineum]
MNLDLKNQNDQWELNLDTDGFDLRLTPVLRPCSNTRDCGEGYVMSTQEYIKKVVEDVGEGEDFKSRSWVRETKYVNANGGISCTSNVIGDLVVTLKDLSGTIPDTIHHKVIDEGGYGKDIIVGSALILDNVSVFTPKPSMYYLNIRMRNVVKVFHKDIVLGSGSGVGGSEMLMEEEEIVKLIEEEEMADLELQVCGNVTDQDKEALNLALEEKARQAQFLMLNEPLTLQSNGNAVNEAFIFAVKWECSMHLVTFQLGPPMV